MPASRSPKSRRSDDASEASLDRYPRPGTPLQPLDPRHAGLDDDAGLLPEPWATQVRRVRGTARQDLRKLLDMEPGEWAARIEELESRRSFRSRAFAELLLVESRARVVTEPEVARRLAEVADLALHWVPGPPGELWRQTARARALAHRANARRCAGDLAEAEAAFQRLHTRVIHERLEDPQLSAEVAGWEAALRWRQGRDDRALELLAWSVDAHRRCGSRPGMAHALGRWADVLRVAGRVDDALGCLDWALDVLEPAAWAQLRRRCRLQRGHALCDAGRFGEATRCAAEAAPPEADEAGGEDPLAAERSWLEGRAADLREPGAAAAAASLLRQVRNVRLAAGHPAEAALACLDGLVAATAGGGGGGDGEAMLAERERVARWLERRAGRAAGVQAGLRGHLELVAVRLRAGLPPPAELSELRRALLREATLASWGAE